MLFSEKPSQKAAHAFGGALAVRLPSASGGEGRSERFRRSLRTTGAAAAVDAVGLEEEAREGSVGDATVAAAPAAAGEVVGVEKGEREGEGRDDDDGGAKGFGVGVGVGGRTS